VVSYFLRYFSSNSTEQISPIPPDLSPVSIRLALLFLLCSAATLGFMIPLGYQRSNKRGSEQHATEHGALWTTYQLSDQACRQTSCHT
jgi:hypothetical protein